MLGEEPAGDADFLIVILQYRVSQKMFSQKIWPFVLFFKTSFHTHYFNFDRIITFCPLLTALLLFSRWLYFGQGVDASSHLSRINILKM